MEQEKRSKVNPTQSMRDAMKKATTEMLVLFMLRQKPMYTYQMAQEVSRLTQGVLTYNTMYLAVYRLQENGFIEEAEKRIEDGRARIYLGMISRVFPTYFIYKLQLSHFPCTLILRNFKGEIL